LNEYFKVFSQKNGLGVVNRSGVKRQTHQRSVHFVERVL